MGERMDDMKRSTLFMGLFCIAIALAAGAASAAEQQNLAPYVPSPQAVVEKMLELAGVASSDMVYDLGCGDGRIVITAAQKYGAHGVGIDIDPDRIRESEANAKAAGVQNLVSFRLEDALKADVSSATVVTLYLLTSSNAALRPMLTRQLKPGARIVSHTFGMGDWLPQKTELIPYESGYNRTIYLWIADGKVRP
jgi:cyclopropane fatty-acyl-phospholipid synthase-like methyltransferase